MKSFECPGCGNKMSEKEPSCRYCGNKNPIFDGSVKPKTASTMVRVYEDGKAPGTNSFMLGLLLGVIFPIGGIVVSILGFKGKKSIAGSIVGQSLVSFLTISGVIALTISSAISSGPVYLREAVHVGDLVYTVNSVYNSSALGVNTSSEKYVVVNITIKNDSFYSNYIFNGMMVYHQNYTSYYVDDKTKDLSDNFYSEVTSSSYYSDYSYISIRKGESVTFNVAYKLPSVVKDTDYLEVKESRYGSSKRNIYLCERPNNEKTTNISFFKPAFSF